MIDLDESRAGPAVLERGDRSLERERLVRVSDLELVEALQRKNGDSLKWAGEAKGAQG